MSLRWISRLFRNNFYLYWVNLFITHLPTFVKVGTPCFILHFDIVEADWYIIRVSETSGCVAMEKLRDNRNVHLFYFYTRPYWNPIYFFVFVLESFFYFSARTFLKNVYLREKGFSRNILIIIAKIFVSDIADLSFSKSGLSNLKNFLN